MRLRARISQPDERKAKPRLNSVQKLLSRRPLWQAARPLPIMKTASVLSAAAALLLAGAGCRAHAEAGESAGLPSVAVAPVVRQDLGEQLTVQAEFRPYQEVELHPKVAGYLRQIFVDFGDRVKAGAPIATIEVPELQDELHRAVAAEKRAAADYADAHLDYQRLIGVDQSRPNLLAQQDLDTAKAKDEMAAANLDAAKADRERYQTLWAYTNVTAPFGGVITQRYADPGALIQAGTASSTQAQPLVRLSENDRLRLDFPISEAYAEDVAVGDPVEIRCGNPERRLSARIVRFTRRIAMDTRTMETEVEVANPDLTLIPGMYATVVLEVNRRPHALAVPVQAIKGSAHPTAWVVGPDNRIEERAVVLGLETPDKFEILSGLREGERVIIGDRSAVQPGQTVAVRQADLAASP
jgi:RND family efflux transporter MFP subunit